MLSKEILIKNLKEAQENKAYLYITYENNDFKFYTRDNLPSDEFLKRYNLDYTKHLVIGINPAIAIKYDYVIYKYDMDVNTFIEQVNKDYKVV